MTAQEFFAKYNNVGLDFDGSYGNQCMDVFEQYNKDVVGAPIVYGNAVDIWTRYPQGFYDKISNDPSNSPQLGDVVIWGTRIGQYGHIAICQVADANHFTSFDQNWPTDPNGKGVCHFQAHDYTGVLGWIRPKNLPPTNTGWIKDYMTEKGIDITNEGDARSKLGDVFDEAAKYDQTNQDKVKAQNDLQEANGRVAEVETENAHLKGDLQQANNDLIDAKQTITERDTTINQLRDQLAAAGHPVPPPTPSQDNWLTKLLKRLRGG